MLSGQFTCQKREEELMKTYHDLFASQPRISGRDSCKGVKFSADLRVLDTKGIDVILGMETLAKWGVRIDCAADSSLVSI